MANNEKTSPAVATLAAKVLSGEIIPTVQQAKTLAASVLTQTPDKPMTLEQGMSIMNSTAGGTFNNVDQSMRLSGRVKGRIERAPKGSQ